VSEKAKSGEKRAKLAEAKAKKEAEQAEIELTYIDIILDLYEQLEEKNERKITSKD